MTGSEPRVVVAGNLSLDDTISPGGTVPLAPGGDALYASSGVAAWGLTPMLLTLVGADYPVDHRARIVASGIDASRIREVAGPTVHYQVTNFPDGRREYRWVSGADRLLATSPKEQDYDVLKGAAWLHLAAMPIEAHEIGVRAAREAGVRFSLDPHEEYVLGYEARIQAMVEGSIFLPSELEARLLFPDLAGRSALEVGYLAAERLDSWRPEVVAVKLGELGSVVRWGGRSVHVPAPPVPVVDSTGAGDAFAGGFIVGWLATQDPRAGAACGTIAAAQVIQQFGAFAPEGDEIRATRLADRIARASAILTFLPTADAADLDMNDVVNRLRAPAVAARTFDPDRTFTRTA